MKSYSTEFSIPDAKPFDQQGNWFQSFVGAIILPITERNQLGRFWFSRYGAVGHGKTALFRFETSDSDIVFAEIEKLTLPHKIMASRPIDYDVGGDIGLGEKSRFLGTNAKHKDQVRRGNLALTFLHASARLMLDCLVGPDADGYSNLESEKVSTFSLETSLEQFHHLFCNMTCVPTYMVVGQPPGSHESVPYTYEEYKGLAEEDGWKFWNARKGEF